MSLSCFQTAVSHRLCPTRHLWEQKSAISSCLSSSQRIHSRENSTMATWEAQAGGTYNNKNGLIKQTRMVEHFLLGACLALTIPGARRTMDVPRQLTTGLCQTLSFGSGLCPLLCTVKNVPDLGVVLHR